MSDPLVSVVVTTWNRAELLQDTLAAILAQTVEDIEVIVVDNESTDDTESRVRAIGDPRVSYVRNANGGVVAVNRNVGVERARGTWVAFCDDDDLWLPDKLEAQLAAARAHAHAAIVACDAEYFSVDEKGVRTVYGTLVERDGDGWISLEDLVSSQRTQVVLSSVLVRRDVFDTVGPWDTSPALFTIEDLQFWIRVAASGLLIRYIDRPLVRFRVHPVSSSAADTRITARKALGMVEDLHDRGVLGLREYAFARKAFVRRARVAAFKEFLKRIPGLKALVYRRRAAAAAAAQQVGAPGHPLQGLRVVLVNNFPGPGMGGGEYQNLAIIAALVEAGANVRAVVVPGSAFGVAAAVKGATVIETPLGLRSLARALRTIRAQAGNAGIVVGTGYFTGILTRLAVPRARTHARVINIVAVMPGTTNAGERAGMGVRLRALIDGLTRGRVDRFVAVAPAVGDALVAGGVPKARVDVIPNGIDVDALEEAAREPLPDHPLLTPDERPLIVCAARLEPVKGVETLVRAAELMPAVRVAIAGDGVLRSGLEELARSLHVEDRVAFLGEVRPVAPLLAAATTVVLPSLSEGLPLVALEAMALTRPVVATRVGGLPQLLRGGECGVLVAPGDETALATAITGLLADPENAFELASAGRRELVEHYTTTVMGSAYVRMFARLAGAVPEEVA